MTVALSSLRYPTLITISLTSQVYVTLDFIFIILRDIISDDLAWNHSILVVRVDRT